MKAVSRKKLSAMARPGGQRDTWSTYTGRDGTRRPRAPSEKRGSEMKKLLILLTALAVSLAAVAGEKHQGSAEDCLAKMQAKYAEKPWLGVKYGKNDNGQTIVKKVFADSPAEEAGFQNGDILLAMQGVEYTKANKTAIKSAYADIKPGSEVRYMVERQGAEVEINATMAHVPKELQKKWIAEHLKSDHPDFQVASKD